ncbi:MAG: hypothetical protein AABW53_00855 [Nanoarchaeota archaeon]
MVLCFARTLSQALENIGFSGGYHKLPVYKPEIVRTNIISDEIIETYGNAKWAVIDILNEKYGPVMSNPFDLHHWLEKNDDDEVAYFLNEAGSNSLNYSQYLVPWRFHLWLGKKGFVIGIEQKGDGFNAVKIHEEKLHRHLGGAFNFFRWCKSAVFFDNPEEARVVYLEAKLF